MKLGYSRQDIDFILDHYNELRGGEWPDIDHAESGNRRPGISCRAKFEDPCLVAGEIAARVKLCGLDGMLVAQRYGMDTGRVLSVIIIEKTWHIELYEVERRINRVKWFCVGSRQKEGAWRNGKLISAYELWRMENKYHKILRLPCNKIAGNLTSRS